MVRLEMAPYERHALRGCPGPKPPQLLLSPIDCTIVLWHVLAQKLHSRDLGGPARSPACNTNVLEHAANTICVTSETNLLTERTPEVTMSAFQTQPLTASGR